LSAFSILCVEIFHENILYALLDAVLRLATGGVPVLVDLLRRRRADRHDCQLSRLRAIVAAVLRNVSQHALIRQSLAGAGAWTVLVRLLDADDAACADVDMASRAADVIADIADSGDEQRHAFVHSGAIDALVRLLDSDVENTLASAVNALRALCSGDVPDIRTAVAAAAGTIPALVEFLSAPSG